MSELRELHPYTLTLRYKKIAAVSDNLTFISNLYRHCIALSNVLLIRKESLQ